jgi:hypothetical protein
MTVGTRRQLSDRHPLGRSSLRVSPVCLGITAEDVVEPAFEAGINFFFVTCDLHWPHYAGLVRGLQRLLASRPSARDDIVIAAVSYSVAELISSAVHDLLQAAPALGRIDVLVVGGARSGDFEDRMEACRAIEARPMHGVTFEAVGASFHCRRTATTAIRDGVVDIAYVRSNPLHPGARREILPHVPDAPALVYNFKNTAGAVLAERCDAIGLPADLWRPEIPDYYRFALSHPRMNGVLAALLEPRQVRALSDALARPELTEEEQQYLIELCRLGQRFRGSQ